jgi:hypothetical protein
MKPSTLPKAARWGPHMGSHIYLDHILDHIPYGVQICVQMRICVYCVASLS